MNPLNQENQQQQHYSTEPLGQLPRTFAEAVTTVKNFALQEFDKEIAQKQLYYHTRDHVNGVQRRADMIFQVIRPYWEASLDSDIASDYVKRMKLLLDLCAIAHDMIQLFILQTEPHTSRRRERGASEAATINRLIDYIKQLNQRLHEHEPESPALFTGSDLHIIREAIEVTNCSFDPKERAIYQPDLYEPDKNLSLVARMIALADIGALAIEGVEVYNWEGSLHLLEDNPDILPLILNRDLQKLELYENIRQRLLRRTRFQVNFAKSRFARYPREVEGLPVDAIPILTNDVFKYLTQEKIQEIELTTPTNEDTTLDELIEFFELDKYISQLNITLNSSQSRTGLNNCLDN